MKTVWLLLFLLIFGMSGQDATATEAPTLADARRVLEQRISRHAEGRIKLVSFNSDADPRPVPWDNDGERRFLITYEAELEFSEPCVWDTQFEDQPVTFKTFKPNVLEPVPNRIWSISRKGETFTIRGQIGVKGASDGWEPTSFYWSDPPERTADLLARRQCILNLKQIGQAFHAWAAVHQGQFPFNVSTNAGGTKEWCRLGPDCFEHDAALHFQVIASRLPNPATLVCPADSAKRIAADIQRLQLPNISYQVRSNTNGLAASAPFEIVHCPIHDLTLYSDGSVSPRLR